MPNDATPSAATVLGMIHSADVAGWRRALDKAEKIVTDAARIENDLPLVQGLVDAARARAAAAEAEAAETIARCQREAAEAEASATARIAETHAQVQAAEARLREAWQAAQCAETKLAEVQRAYDALTEATQNVPGARE